MHLLSLMLLSDVHTIKAGMVARTIAGQYGSMPSLISILTGQCDAQGPHTQHNVAVQVSPSVNWAALNHSVHQLRLHANITMRWQSHACKLSAPAKPAQEKPLMQEIVPPDPLLLSCRALNSKQQCSPLHSLTITQDHHCTCGRGVVYSSDMKSGRKNTSEARNASWRTLQLRSVPLRASMKL